MLHKFETVVNGISKYIDNEIYSGMTDTQEFVARLFVGRVIENEGNVKKALINNGIVRTFGIIDGDGMVDVCALCKDLKREIERKGKVSFTIPMFGKLTFESKDVDVIYKYITGEDFI